MICETLSRGAHHADELTCKGGWLDAKRMNEQFGGRKLGRELVNICSKIDFVGGGC